MADERSQVEGPLAGKQPVVPAPREDVHDQRRGVGQLQEEDAVSGDLLDLGRVVTTGQDVEAVEAHAHGRVVGELDDAPGASVVVDEPSPRERLVGQPDAVTLGLFAQSPQLCRRDRVVVDGRRADVAADEHGVDAEALHERELGPRTVQHGLELVVSDALRVAEGLVEVEGQPQSAGQRDDFLGTGRRGDQVRLEDLDPVEPGRCGGVQLLDEGAAEADGGDRRSHGVAPHSLGAEGDRILAGLRTSS